MNATAFVPKFVERSLEVQAGMRRCMTNPVGTVPPVAFSGQQFAVRLFTDTFTHGGGGGSSVISRRVTHKSPSSDDIQRLKLKRGRRMIKNIRSPETKTRMKLTADSPTAFVTDTTPNFGRNIINSSVTAREVGRVVKHLRNASTSNVNGNRYNHGGLDMSINEQIVNDVDSSILEMLDAVINDKVDAADIDLFGESAGFGGGSAGFGNTGSTKKNKSQSQDTDSTHVSNKVNNKGHPHHESINNSKRACENKESKKGDEKNIKQSDSIRSDSSTSSTSFETESTNTCSNNAASVVVDLLNADIECQSQCSLCGQPVPKDKAIWNDSECYCSKKCESADAEKKLDSFVEGLLKSSDTQFQIAKLAI
eukprot:CAMPEP_0197516544 /NCGR_PEP_ID=MMETSP1318-20131121/1419_1 /TAXON_ID=552666 /ORGANISM="Partenskyella glossopodia, Strain RCC365" /LENGTH=365 /DNA_ID=CAMNT_0043065369 /DNA_START=381 /DNA_END=1478 /DNA_ORIENTATION=-